MAIITLKIAVSNVDIVLQQFDKIKIHRSVTGEAGPYNEITTPGDRPTLVSGQVIYPYTDVAGADTYFYRSSYFNSVSALESSLSDPQEGEGNAALDIIGVDELKELYLFGLDLTDDDGTEYPDTLYEHFIKAAVSEWEHRLDMPIIPQTYNEELDFFKEDYDKYIWMEVDNYPVIDVSRIRLVLPGEQVVQDFPNDWIHILKEAGQIQLVPGTGTAGTILLGAAGNWLPFIYGNNRFIPRVFRVDYTAGFAAGQVPAVIKEVVGMTAAFGPLNIAGDLLGGAGIASQSVGIDGLSTAFSTTSSATSSGYGARILIYQKKLKELEKVLKSYYNGLRLSVV